MGIAKIKEYIEKFDLNKVFGIDLEGETFGVAPSPEYKAQIDKQNPIWRVGDTYNSSIGQGYVEFTLLGLVEYLSGIINDNIIMKPYLVNEIKAPNGDIVFKGKPVMIDELGFKEENLDIVKGGMRAMVVSGSAQILNIPGMAVAGKTGTPQVSGGDKLNALFIGYAPIDNPEIAIVVLVENIPEGSLAVLPIAKDVFSWYAANRYIK